MNSLVLSVLAAALFSSPARAEADREVVKVNGTPIRQSEVMERLWKRYGPGTLEEMVDELLLRQNAQSQNIKAEPAEVNRRLSRIRGQFSDAGALEAQLKQSGSSIEALKQDLADQITQEKIIIAKNHISITDDDLKSAFKARKDQLATPPSVHLLHMLVADEKDALEIIQKLKGGSDFKALAREKSLAPTGKINGGDYGFVARGMLPPELEEIAFSMKAKDIKMVPGAHGVHILQVLGQKPAVPAEYSKIKDELRELLLSEKIKAAIPAYLQELRRKADIKPQGA